MTIGDKVRVIRIPPSVEKESPPETVEIFRRCVGQILHVDGFDEYGHLELNVRTDRLRCGHRSYHTIWIEPEFVEVT